MKQKILFIFMFAGAFSLLYSIGAHPTFGWHYGDRGYGCGAEVGGHSCGGGYGGQQPVYGGQGGGYGGQGGGYRGQYGGQGGGYRSRYGSQYRGQYRGQVPPPPPRPNPPTGLTSSCPTPGNAANISWNAPTNAPVSKYQLRVDDTTANDWNGLCNGAQEPGDICDNNKTTRSQAFTGTPQSEYNWWVHACNVSGCSAAAYASFSCAAPPTYSISGSIYTDENGDKTKNPGEKNYTEGKFVTREWGIAGDVAVPADYDGDGKDDVAVIRQYDVGEGDKIEWYFEGKPTITWGRPSGRDIPVPADYDGDGKDDVAIYRPTEGTWYVYGKPAVAWGLPNDIPVPGDYNGDGKDDFAIYRPIEGSEEGKWYVHGQPAPFNWGLKDDIPIPGDYNGDGTDEFAVYRTSENQWYTWGDSGVVWGREDDLPVPADYTGDGITDFAVYRPADGKWFVHPDIEMSSIVEIPEENDVPVPSDYNGDGRTDVAIYSVAAGKGDWFIREPSTISVANTPLNKPIVGIASTPSGQGYWAAGADGGVFGYGDAPYKGSLGALALNKKIVGIASTPSGQGYWLVGKDGGIFAFGDAPFKGSLGGTTLAKPIVGMAAHPSGNGYWLVAADGGVFAYNVPFHGSLGGTTLAKPIVGMASTPSGNGYWLVGADGGIYAFGGAPFHGSLGGTTLAKPIVGMAAHPSGNGYWLVASDGGIFAYNAPFHGSLGGTTLAKPIVGMASYKPTGQGYWLVGADLGIFNYGSAQFKGAQITTTITTLSGNYSVGGLYAGNYPVTYDTLDPNHTSTHPPGNPPGFSINVGAGFACNGSPIPFGYCDAGNAKEVNFGVKRTNEPVNGDRPRVTKASIASSTVKADGTPTVKADGTTPYTITLEATDPQGGNDIGSMYTTINLGGIHAGGSNLRGSFGWDTTGGFQGLGQAEAPITCTGDGEGTIFDFYNPEYVKLISCEAPPVAAGSNTRIIKLTVAFNTNFTEPENNNKLSGYARDWGGLEDIGEAGTPHWRHLGEFSLILPPSACSISGSVFIDLNGDNKKNLGEQLYTENPSRIEIDGVTTVTTTGDYCVPRLPTGPHRVYFTNVPAGYRVHPPGTPPRLDVTTGTSLATCEVSAPTNNSTGGICNAAGNVENLNFALTNSGSWIQGYNLDFRFDKGRDNPIPWLSPFGLYTIDVDSAVGPTGGILYSGDSPSTFNQGYGSISQWLAGGTNYPETYSYPVGNSLFTSYSYLKSIIDRGQIASIDMDSNTVCGSGGIGNCQLQFGLPKGVYHADGDVNLHFYNFPQDRDYIFLIKGTLTIDGNIFIPKETAAVRGSTALFSALKDIKIDRNVGIAAAPPKPNLGSGQLQGFFTAGRDFLLDGLNTCPTADKMLNVEGSIAVNAEGTSENGGTPGKFINRRSLCAGASSGPTMTITPRLDFILNAPSFLQRANTITNEAAP